MKKLFYVLIALVAISVVGCKPDPDPDSQVQVLSLEWNGETYAADTLVIVDSELEFGEMVCHVIVRNNTENEVNVMLRKTVVNEVEGSENYFCWGECYMPDVEVSAAAVAIPANGTTQVDQFGGHYMPNDNAGITDIKYTFFVEGNEDSNISFTARYEYIYL